MPIPAAPDPVAAAVGSAPAIGWSPDVRREHHCRLLSRRQSNALLPTPSKCERNQVFGPVLSRLAFRSFANANHGGCSLPISHRIQRRQFRSVSVGGRVAASQAGLAAAATTAVISSRAVPETAQASVTDV